MRYRKKPVVIEAVQYDGNFRCLDIFSIDDVGKFIIGTDDAGNPCLKIPTLEGIMIASKGDYIIRGVKGEYYPCKPDVFEMTYDRDEPTVIQEPIKNYDPWNEVINQLGDTNEMIDHIGEINEMVKQTAVEWLIEQLRKPNTDSYISKIIEQALAMEKEQIMDAYIKDRGLVKLEKAMQIMDNAEQYYNEIYKPNKL